MFNGKDSKYNVKNAQNIKYMVIIKKTTCKFQIEEKMLKQFTSR